MQTAEQLHRVSYLAGKSPVIPRRGCVLPASPEPRLNVPCVRFKTRSEGFGSATL
jgi:hypothetical protein